MRRAELVEVSKGKWW